MQNEPVILKQPSQQDVVAGNRNGMALEPDSRGKQFLTSISNLLHKARRSDTPTSQDGPDFLLTDTNSRVAGPAGSSGQLSARESPSPTTLQGTQSGQVLKVGSLKPDVADTKSSIGGTGTIQAIRTSADSTSSSTTDHLLPFSQSSSLGRTSSVPILSHTAPTAQSKQSVLMSSTPDVDTDSDAWWQIAALQHKLLAKDMELEVLQSQVHRLSNFVDGVMGTSVAPEQVCSSMCRHMPNSVLVVSRKASKQCEHVNSCLSVVKQCYPLVHVLPVVCY